MKRYYLIHESDWEKPVEFIYHSGPLWHCFEGKGSCWMDLRGGLRLLVGDFKDENREHVWNSHPATVHLHHPVRERTLPLGALLTPEHAHKRFRQSHFDALAAAIGITLDDTMESLNAKAASIHPGCTIYPIPKNNPLWIY